MKLISRSYLYVFLLASLLAAACLTQPVRAYSVCSIRR